MWPASTIVTMSTRLPVQIDRSSPVPLYFQLAEQLSAAITDGVLKPGDPFENEMALAERLNLSRPTVRRAIHELVNQGMLLRRRGIGTTVASPMVHRQVELTSLYDDLARAQREPRTEVLSLDTEAHDERAAHALGLPADTPVVAIVRVRFAGDLPLAVLHNWLPPALADLTRDELERGGLYALLRARNMLPVVAQQSIGARNATAEERRLLGITRSRPVLTMSRHAYDAAGSAVEFGVHCYRSDQYAIDVMVYDR